MKNQPKSIGEILKEIREQQRVIRCELKQRPFHKLCNKNVEVLVCFN
jgi:hypothetical protein